MKHLSVKALALSALVATSCLGKKEAQEIENMTEFRQIMSSKQPVLIMFYAPWCGACTSMKEPLNNMARLFDKEARIAKINADNEKCKEAIDLLGVEAIPTFAIKHVGVVDEKQLETVIKSLLGKEVTKKEQPRPAVKQPAKKQPAKKASAQKQPAKRPAAPKKGSPQKKARLI